MSIRVKLSVTHVRQAIVDDLHGLANDSFDSNATSSGYGPRIERCEEAGDSILPVAFRFCPREVYANAVNSVCVGAGVHTNEAKFQLEIRRCERANPEKTSHMRRRFFWSIFVIIRRDASGPLNAEAITAPHVVSLLRRLPFRVGRRGRGGPGARPASAAKLTFISQPLFTCRFFCQHSQIDLREEDYDSRIYAADSRTWERPSRSHDRYDSEDHIRLNLKNEYVRL
ncbi:hypothetical protein EVAR_66329_1 [Eumeta japonica]|uniref:Uncharacterized protein n=1 Tax=Eumeta variegata TaxID=151549 RepID=A0A4C1Z3Q7_EUMVA|nr:hypothetical protein EVAR_66329_1 [Eumeta japonica]